MIDAEEENRTTLDDSQFKPDQDGIRDEPCFAAAVKDKTLCSSVWMEDVQIGAG